MNKILNFIAKAGIIMLIIIDIITLRLFHTKLGGLSGRIIKLWIKYYKL